MLAATAFVSRLGALTLSSVSGPVTSATEQELVAAVRPRSSMLEYRAADRTARKCRYLPAAP